jgi:hypothetical protein
VAAWSVIPFVALRFSNIVKPDEYQLFPRFWSDPASSGLAFNGVPFTSVIRSVIDEPVKVTRVEMLELILHAAVAMSIIGITPTPT